MDKKTLGLALLVCALGGMESFGCEPYTSASAAKQTADTVAAGYDYILVERVGGGDKLFAITPMGSDSINAEFSRYGFRDSTFSLGLSLAELGDTLKATLEGIFQGTQPIVRQDTVRSARGFMMGSWLKCHAVKDTVKTVVTDEKAKDALAEIEHHIVSKMEEKK